MRTQKIEQKFLELFENSPLLISSPGRVNLIGEHVDYNDGLVLPAAIDKTIIFAIAKNNNNICRVYSDNFDQQVEFSPHTAQHADETWVNYIIGVVDQLTKAGHKITGFDCLFGGDIPVGAGLSSSAAVECGITFALNQIFKLDLQKLDIVNVAKTAENDFIGMQCGIMDQFANIFGKENHILKLDCRSLEYEYHKVNFSGHTLLLFDTGVKHSLASSEYNLRREECTKGLTILKEHYPQVTSLRDCTLNMLSSCVDTMDAIIYKRCDYVIREIIRVEQACNLLERGELKAFGQLMFDTHNGLSNDYEVSCRELDVLVDLVIREPAVLGARMMGGGFGGCTINLVINSEAQNLQEHISKRYKKITGLNLNVYQVNIGAGTSLVG